MQLSIPAEEENARGREKKRYNRNAAFIIVNAYVSCAAQLLIILSNTQDTRDGSIAPKRCLLTQLQKNDVLCMVSVQRFHGRAGSRYREICWDGCSAFSSRVMKRTLLLCYHLLLLSF